jgi:hypothetical protein
MIGMYLAEGYSGKRSIGFGLHLNEIEFQDRLMRIFKGYGFKVRVDHRKGLGVTVSVSSSMLAEWFPAWMGKRCYNKHIPNELMLLPERKARALLRGIFDGDGSKSAPELGQTSEILALQVTEILQRLGEQPTNRLQRAKALTPNGNERALCFVTSHSKDGFDHAHRKGRWNFGGDLLAQIVEWEQVGYDGEVFNLEVDGDHTYVAQNTLVHNCFGTTFMGGYYDQIDVFVDVNPSPNVVQVSNFGKLEVNSTVMFMSNFPLAKPNDLIVEPTNRRWRVVQVNTVTEKRYIVQQYLQVEEVERSDSEYGAPVDLDLKHPPEDFVGFFPKRFSPKEVPTEGSGLL